MTESCDSIPCNNLYFLQRTARRLRLTCPSLVRFFVSVPQPLAAALVFCFCSPRGGFSVGVVFFMGTVVTFNAIEVVPADASPSPMIRAMIRAGLLDWIDRLDTKRARSSASWIVSWRDRTLRMCSFRRFLSLGAIPHSMPRMVRGTETVAFSR